MTLLLPLVVVVALLHPGPSYAATPVTCQGQPATVVGPLDTDGGNLVGTEGDDVIVVNGATSVQALGGDDLICEGTDEAGLVRIDAGAGDDSLLFHGQSVATQLGPGSDTFVNAVAKTDYTDDEVFTGDDQDVALGDAPGHDVVRGGAGFDSVWTGVGNLPDDDDISLGGNYDHVYLDGIPTGRIDAGPDENELQVHTRAATDWRLDLGAATAVVGGRRLSLRGFTDLTLAMPWTSLSVRGTHAEESLTLRPPGGMATGPLDVALGAGQDALAWFVSGPGRIRGGAGPDYLQLVGRSGTTLAADQATSRWFVSPHLSGMLAGFESIGAFGFDAAWLTGSDAPDRLTVDGCRARVDGGPGNDHLGVTRPPGCEVGTPDARVLRGGRGDDQLQGSTGADVLLGGPGRDIASGSGGQDRCVAEVRIGCES